MNKNDLIELLTVCGYSRYGNYRDTYCKVIGVHIHIVIVDNDVFLTVGDDENYTAFSGYTMQDLILDNWENVKGKPIAGKLMSTIFGSKI